MNDVAGEYQTVTIDRQHITTPRTSTQTGADFLD